VAFAYGAGGLLARLTDAKQNPHMFSYDALGKLERDSAPDDAQTSVTSTRSGTTTTATIRTAMGRTSTYLTQKLDGNVERRVYTDAAGLQTITTTEEGRTLAGLLPDGVRLSMTYMPHPRFGSQSPDAKTFSFSTPAGRTVAGTFSRTSITDAANPMRVATETVSVTANGKVYQTVYDGATRSLVERSPSGRMTMTALDATGRAIRAERTGLAPVAFEYDARGLLQAVTMRTRRTTFAYNDRLELVSTTGPMQRTESFEYDAAGRLVRQLLPDAREVRFSYDANGNLLSLTPPSRPGHRFNVTAGDLLRSYTPPSSGEIRYTYDADRQITSVDYGDGIRVMLTYDPAGRLISMDTSEGAHTLTYDASGSIASIRSPDGAVMTFTYDGPLLTSIHSAGTASGSATYTYGDDWRIATESVNGSTVSYQYDADHLLTGAGSLALRREATTGLVGRVQIGNVTEDWAYTEFGEPSRYIVRYGALTVLDSAHVRDDSGRIVRVSETTAGGTTAYEYAYDSAGRLEAVTRDGITVGRYTYDPNGNRLSHADASGTVTAATYDQEDRLLSYAGATFTYNDRGALSTKVDAIGTATYEYDPLGSLRTVVLPSGKRIAYVIDPAGRRAGRTIDGVLTAQWVYGADGLRILAELDGAGALRSRFVYATRANVPDYMMRDGKTYRIVSDHRGSPRFVINVADSALVQRIDYDEFGNVLIDTNPGFQPFGFAGGLYDHDTRLVLFGARDYDSHTGRFMSKDPIGFAGGDTNLYAYVLGDPVNLIDPTGLDWTDTAASFSAGLGDALLLGFGDELRAWTDRAFGWNGSAFVDQCSAAYSAGEWTGIVASTLAGGVTGAGGRGLQMGMSRANAAFPRGLEWVERSHWIAQLKNTRFDGAWNLRNMWGTEHALADPSRYRFMRRWWKAANPLPGPVSRQIARVPDWARGAAGGAAYGGAGAGLAGAGCGCN
jgi:RHS repeat-associated protein